MIVTLWITIGIIFWLIGITNYRINTINTNQKWMYMNTKQIGKSIANSVIEDQKLQDQIDELKKKKEKN